MSRELYLTIDGHWYHLRRVVPAPGTAKACWELKKPNDSAYHVHRDQFGVACDCPDYTYRHMNTPDKCKHCKALIDLGLI